MKLQPNEKRLLIILAVVAILALSFQYLILPELKIGQELSNSNKSLSLAYNMISDKNGQSTDIEMEYNQAKRMFDGILDKDLSRYLGYEELDQYFTTMALKNGLKPTALIIENPKDINKGAVEYSNIKVVYVIIEASGSMDQLFALMNDIEGQGFLKIENINTVKDNKTYEHNIKVSVVMLKG